MIARLLLVSCFALIVGCQSMTNEDEVLLVQVFKEVCGSYGLAGDERAECVKQNMLSDPGFAKIKMLESSERAQLRHESSCTMFGFIGGSEHHARCVLEISYAEYQKLSAVIDSLGAAEAPSYGAGGHRIQNCIGAVVNGVCQGSPSSGDRIRNQTGQNPKCHGAIVGGRCVGAEY